MHLLFGERAGSESPEAEAADRGDQRGLIATIDDAGQIGVQRADECLGDGTHHRTGDHRHVLPDQQTGLDAVADDPFAEVAVALPQPEPLRVDRRDHRLLVVVGSCSIHDPDAALDYAERLMRERERLSDTLEIVRRTGCGLLLDVNNVYVACTNRGADPTAYVDAFPLDAVGEIHLGGHDAQEDEHGAPLLIDSHGARVIDPVWALYAHTIARTGPRPTLIEWDNDVPDWPVLAAEAARAAGVLEAVQ